MQCDRKKNRPFRSYKSQAHIMISANGGRNAHFTPKGGPRIHRRTSRSFFYKRSQAVFRQRISTSYFSSVRLVSTLNTEPRKNLEIRRSGQTQQEKPPIPKIQTAHNDKCQRGRNTRFTPKGGPRIHHRTSRSFFYKRSQTVFRQRISTSYFSSVRLVSTLNTEPMKNTT